MHPEVLTEIEKRLRLPDPSYAHAMKRSPNAKFFLSPYINYYAKNKSTGSVSVPRGWESELRGVIRDVGCDAEWIDRRVTKRADIDSLLVLREYQRGIPETIANHDSGVVRCDTGFGKSVIAIATAAELGQRTLIVVPKLDLLNQFVHEIERFTNSSPGVIQGSQVDIQAITVATAQSLANRIRDGSVPGDAFGAILVDECHLFITPKRRALVEHFSARYRFGFTATARRSDGQGKAIFWLFGDKLVDRQLPRASPHVRIVPFNGHIWVDEYAQMVEEQTKSEERNSLIARLATEQIEMGKKVLILCKRVAHYKHLSERIKSPTVEFDSDMSREDRQKLLQELKTNPDSYDCILGTFHLLSTGVDIPSLDTLIIAGDLKSDVLAEQSAGRILRLFEGKGTPLIIDIHDVGNGIFKRQGKDRYKFYKLNNWEIV